MRDASPVASLTTTKKGLAMAESNHSSVPEGFKEIPGYGGRYFINQQGDVWSAFKRGLMSLQTDATHPYPWVLLRENGKAQPRTVYYLMRLTWMPSCPGEIGVGRGKWCVNHKDGNKLNSNVNNLEWVTNEENLRHAWRTGLRNDAIGENASNSSLTSEQVREIRLRLLLGEKINGLSNEFNLRLACIKKIQWFVSWKRQDHDLVEPMLKICRSKWLRVMKTKLDKGGSMEECCNRSSRKRLRWNEESLALYL